MHAPRRFRLYRYQDVSGVSGTGVVAYGCMFTSGKAVLAWCIKTEKVEEEASHISSLSIFDNIEDAIAVHGHHGMTRVEWIDPLEKGEKEEQDIDQCIDTG